MVSYDVKRVSKGTESFMVSFDFAKTPITQIADYIIIAASKHNASDIHFDPREDGMMVRFRIDGDCQDYTFIPKAYERNLTTRLKLLANMNITESRLPQDGAIKGTFGDVYLDMRVSSLPVNEGEKVVIRILDYSRSLSGIETLGFHPKNLEKIKRMMAIPNGIILTTGATGSGKSTTNYSILQGLNKPETNIITVEDPIEMNIEGINQVQVNSEIGMTFAAALRSILRQDPNIILIGEIRDSETAQIAVRASITGHLVLSTIHTNNSLATIERLLDMDVERYLLSTALTGIISQRLAKQICKDCRIQRDATKYEQKIFKKYLHQDIQTIWDANPKGCEHCRHGYHGRLAFHEVLELDDDIRSALNNDKVEKKELAKMVYTGKTITMLQDALIKVLEGKTSFEEVYRVIEIENEDDENYEQELSVIMPKVEKKEEEKNEEESDSLLEINRDKSTDAVQVQAKAQAPIQASIQNNNINKEVSVKDNSPKTTIGIPKINANSVNQKDVSQQAMAKKQISPTTNSGIPQIKTNNQVSVNKTVQPVVKQNSPIPKIVVSNNGNGNNINNSASASVNSNTSSTMNQQKSVGNNQLSGQQGTQAKMPTPTQPQQQVAQTQGKVNLQQQVSPPNIPRPQQAVIQKSISNVQQNVIFNQAQVKTGSPQQASSQVVKPVEVPHQVIQKPVQNQVIPPKAK